MVLSPALHFGRRFVNVVGGAVRIPIKSSPLIPSLHWRITSFLSLLVACIETARHQTFCFVVSNVVRMFAAAC